MNAPVMYCNILTFFETSVRAAIGVASYGTLGHVPPRLPTMRIAHNNPFSSHFGLSRTYTEPTLSGSLFSIALKTCKISNDGCSIMLQKH